MNTRLSSVEFLLEQYGLTPAHLKAISDYNKFRELDIKLIIEEFYQWLLLSPEFANFFSDANTLFHVKRQQTIYWQEFLDANVDEYYIKRRHEVGIAHARIGLPVQPYFSSMAFFLRKISQPLFTQSSLNDQELFCIEAITSLAQLDVSIAMEAIFRHHAESFDRMAQGDFSYQNKPLSDGDLFGIALRNMTITLNEVEHSCEQIADGILDTNITVKSPDDRLAIAINRMISRLNDVAELAKTVADGDYNLDFQPSSKNDVLANSLNVMTYNLKALTQSRSLELARAKSLSALTDTIRESKDTADFCLNVLNYLCKQLNVFVGRLYLFHEDHFYYQSGYADSIEQFNTSAYKPGEGLVGQAGVDGKSIVIENLPADYIKISSALGESSVNHLLVWPVKSDHQVELVFEFGTNSKLDADKIEFLKECEEKLGVSYLSVKSQEKITELLDESLDKTKILEDTNTALEEQTQALKSSEESLMSQQQELELSNQKLTHKTRDLEEQKRVLLDTQSELEEKSMQLELASQYKSEFLANMSHELRTPLNSMLLLASILSENQSNNLSEDELESAKVIYKGGQELLELINDILDLSKVEAGKMDIAADEVDIKKLLSSLLQRFSPQAEVKGVSIKIDIESILPDTIISDTKKIVHIVRNLVSNAIKFTEKGTITLTLRNLTSPQDKAFKQIVGGDGLAIVVSDTGIGIPKEKQELIFDAFQQADGTTSRQYGGTGLGLSIVKQYTQLLGGALHLNSVVNQGSKFTVYLPKTVKTISENQAADLFQVPLNKKDASDEIDIVEKALKDDVTDINPGDKVLLIVEDDDRFSNVLAKIARSKEYKLAIARDGNEGYQLARKLIPNAILLDVMLPGIDGWALFDKIKDDPTIRHIPIQFISAHHDLYNALQKGAVGYISKPVTKESLLKVFNRFSYFQNRSVSHLIIASENQSVIDSLGEKIKADGIRISSTTIAQIPAFSQLNTVDCIVIDVDENIKEVLSVLEILSTIVELTTPPIIIYTQNTLDEELRIKIMDYTSLAIKEVSNADALLDDVTLFLHSVTKDLRQDQKEILNKVHTNKEIFDNKKILIVDDDMRNVFALSKLLRSKGMEVVVAEDGRIALETLNNHKDVDLILMDIMMPIMDGYEAIRQIRNTKLLCTIPIIALTAKALPEDRHKSLIAGANDYLAKPIDTNRLLMTIRVWLQNAIEYS